MNMMKIHTTILSMVTNLSILGINTRQVDSWYKLEYRRSIRIAVTTKYIQAINTVFMNRLKQNVSYHCINNYQTSIPYVGSSENSGMPIVHQKIVIG